MTLLFLMELARYVQSTQNRNLVIYLQCLNNCFCVPLWFKAFRYFFANAVMLVVTCFILGIKMATKIKTWLNRQFKSNFYLFHGPGNWFGKYEKSLKVSANVPFKVRYLQCKIWGSSISSQVLKNYYKMQKVTGNDNFQSFFIIFKPSKLVLTTRNNSYIFTKFSVYIFYKEKFTK